MGADELCIKDMAGFLPPTRGVRSSSQAPSATEVGLPVVVHTHSSSGMSTLTCLAAADAGAVAVDSALSPFAGGTHPAADGDARRRDARDAELDPKLDLGALSELAEYFHTVLDHYRPMLNLRSLQTDPGILVHQVPGGMLSNLLSQLAEQDALAAPPGGPRRRSRGSAPTSATRRSSRRRARSSGSRRS